MDVEFEDGNEDVIPSIHNAKNPSEQLARHIVSAHIYSRDRHGELPTRTGELLAKNERSGVHVYAAYYEGDPVAVKISPIPGNAFAFGDDDPAAVIRRRSVVIYSHECSVMRRLETPSRHPNLLHLVNCFFRVMQRTDNTRALFFYLVTPLMDGDFYGLSQTLYGQRPVKVDLARRIIQTSKDQIFSGLAWMHQQNVIHCDLKPDNIMYKIDMDGNLRVCICDFGNSTVSVNQVATINDDYPNEHISWVVNIEHAPVEVLLRRYVFAIYDAHMRSATDASNVTPAMLRRDYLPIVQAFNRYSFSTAIDVWGAGVLMVWLHDIMDMLTSRSNSRVNFLYTSDEEHTLQLLHVMVRMMLTSWKRAACNDVPSITHMVDAIARLMPLYPSARELLELTKTENNTDIEFNRNLLGDLHDGFFEVVRHTQMIDPSKRPPASAIAAYNMKTKAMYTN